jgi:hypothetical protein
MSAHVVTTSVTTPHPPALRASPAASALPDWAALQADAERAAALFAMAPSLSADAASELEPPRHFLTACLALCAGWVALAVVAWVLWSDASRALSAGAEAGAASPLGWRPALFSSYGNPPGEAANAPPPQAVPATPGAGTARPAGP